MIEKNIKEEEIDMMEDDDMEEPYILTKEGKERIRVEVEQRLLTCPLCGEWPTLHISNEVHKFDDGQVYQTIYYYIHCEECGLTTKTFSNDNEESIVDYWNTKIKRKKVSKLLKEYLESLKED